MTKLQTVKQPSKLRMLSGHDAATDAFAHDTAFVDRKASGLDLVDLVVRVLIGGTDSGMGLYGIDRFRTSIILNGVGVPSWSPYSRK